MFAPLSGKQQREWLKFSGKESRESAKMENDEKRKERLHEIKLKEAAAKAEQSLGHKDELHGIKIEELSGPLGKKPRMNREKLGLPSSNPMTGTGMFKQGQHMLAQGTDTVPAMLTPGEAVIPRAAAQDPRNKPMITKMVQQGRQAQKFGKGTTGVIDIPHQLAMLPTVKPVKKRMGYENGTIDAQDEQMYNPDKYAEGSMNVVYKDGKACYADGTTSAHELEMAPNVNEDGSVYSGIPMMHGGYVPHYENGTVDANYEFDTQGDRQGLNPYGLRPQIPAETAQGLDYTMPTPKGSGYMGSMPSADGKMMTEYTMDDNKGQYPSMVPTLSAEELKTISNGEMTPEIDNKAKAYRDANVAAGQSPFASSTGLKAPMGYGDFLYKEGQPKPVNISEVSPVPKAATVSVPVPSVVDGTNMPAVPTVPSVVDGTNMPPVSETVPVATPRSMAPPPKAPIEDRTNPEYWIRSFKGANSDVEKAADRYKNDDKGFVESFSNIFSFKGVKDALGLNNQEIARMAVMYLGSRARGYNSAKSLSFAGKNAFETSLQRQGRESSEIAADRRAEKSDERAVRTAAVSMAGQASRDIREDERIKQRYEVEDNRIKARERKDELIRLTAERKEVRKEVENDMDRYENFSSKDVPAAVRTKAFNIAYAPLKGETPEERIQEQRNNLRNATVLLANNTVYKDPNSDRHDRIPKWDWYEDAKGNSVYAARDPYGSGNMVIKKPDGKLAQVSGEQIKPSGFQAKKVEMVSNIVGQYLEGVKGKDNKPIDTKAVGTKFASIIQDFPGVADNPHQANAAIEQTFKNLARDGNSKDYSTEGIRKAFTGQMIMTLNPSNAQLFVDQKAKPVSGSSTVEFGDAITKYKDKNNMTLENSSQYFINKWNGMSADEKSKVLVRPGYSRFQEFVIKYEDKPK